jgi:SCP-2 sterol transfer family protein
MPNETAIDPGAFLRDQVAPRVARRIEDLRAEIDRLHRELADRMTAEATVALVLEGPDGGTWYLNLHDGRMVVDAEAAQPPLVSVHQTRADWEALAAAAGGAPPMGTDLTASRIERLREIRGTLEFRLTTGDTERRVEVRLGPDGSGTRCTLSLKAEDALRLQSGELRPEVAFMQGLVKLQGDLTLAMQLGAVLFGRR